PRLDGADLHDRGTVAEPGGRAGRTAHPRPSRTRSAGRQGPEGRLNRCRPTATSLTERGCTAERPAPHRPAISHRGRTLVRRKRRGAGVHSAVVSAAGVQARTELL